MGRLRDALGKPLGEQIVDFGVIYETEGLKGLRVELSVFREREGEWHLPLILYWKTLRNLFRHEIHTPDPLTLAEQMKRNLATLRPGPPPTPADKISMGFGIGWVIRLIHGIKGSKMLVRHSWPDTKGSWIRFHAYLDRKDRRRVLMQTDLDLAGKYEGTLFEAEVVEAIIRRLETLKKD